MTPSRLKPVPLKARGSLEQSYQVHRVFQFGNTARAAMVD
jgi:hypothetical protein